MEIYGTADTAQDLFEMLSKIPQAQRERLPIQIIVNECHDASGDLLVHAYETTETEGCTERGFQIQNIME